MAFIIDSTFQGHAFHRFVLEYRLMLNLMLMCSIIVLTYLIMVYYWLISLICLIQRN